MSILNVNKINPVGGGSTITIAGIASVTNNISVGNSVTATTYYGDGSNLTGAAPTINNNAGNKVITGSNTTNTLEAQDTLRYDGTNFLIGTNTEAPYNNRNLTVAAGASGNSTVAIEIRSPSNGTGRVIFSDGTSADSSANEGQVIYQQSDHKMLFGVAANYQNMALESTGGTGADLNLIDGNLKFASGHGIDFSASSHATGMSSELLDDYEEGDHDTTVTMSGDTSFSYSSRTLTYTKIGRAVFVTGRINMSGAGGSSFRFTLPFTCGDGSFKYETSNEFQNIRFNDGYTFRIRSNTAYVDLQSDGSDTGIGAGNPHINVNIFYFTA